MDSELARGVARLGRGEGAALRRAGVGALVVSGLWLVGAGVLVGLAAVDEGRHGSDDHGHGSGVLLWAVLIGVPVLTWIGAHLVISLCLLRGQRWARVGAIVAFGVSGLLPLWLFPLHPVGFVNGLLCAGVVALAVPR